MILRILAVVSVLLLGGCAPRTRSAPGVDILDPALAAAVRSESARPECRTSGATGEGDRDPGSAEDRFCEGVALLARARPVPGPRRDAAFYTDAIRERLDLLSFRSSLRPRMDEGTVPVIGALPFLSPVQRGFSLVSNRDDWFYAFTVVARADFTGDGREDWLVFVDDRSREGTYRAHGVLVLADALAPGPIRATLQR